MFIAGLQPPKESNILLKSSTNIDFFIYPPNATYSQNCLQNQLKIAFNLALNDSFIVLSKKSTVGNFAMGFLILPLYGLLSKLYSKMQIKA